MAPEDIMDMKYELMNLPVGLTAVEDVSDLILEFIRSVCKCISVWVAYVFGFYRLQEEGGGACLEQSSLVFLSAQPFFQLTNSSVLAQYITQTELQMKP